MPRVSIICPVFRGAAYIGGWLEKLPQQTIFEDVQLMLDLNEPNSKELRAASEFATRYRANLKSRVVSPVEPISASMNWCIQQADAPLVAIWNIDDLRCPDSLERQCDFLEQNPDYGIVHGGFNIVRSFGSTEGPLTNHIGIGDSPSRELTRGMVMGPFLMWRKSLCDEAGYFDEQLRSGADFDLAIRLAVHAKAKCLEGSLGWYLDEGKGASTSGSLQAVERTLIELRYGILDKVQQPLVRAAMQLDVYGITNFGERQPVCDFVPDYAAFALQNH